MRRFTQLLSLVLLSAFVSGCFPWVYKLNIQQGNIVKPEMLAKLEPGMSQRQVRYILGSPVLNNMEDDKVWEYFYSLEERDEVTKQYLIHVFFDDAGTYQYYQGNLPSDVESGVTNALPDAAQEEREGVNVTAPES